MPDRVMRVPECVPVLFVEQLIFYLAGGGLLLMVGGSNWTLPPMPAGALLAGVLAFVVSLAMIGVRAAWTGPSDPQAGAVQQVAMAWLFAYTLHYTVFSLLLRLHVPDDGASLTDDPFIVMYNAERVQPFGLGLTTMHMVVSLVLCALLLALFTATHYFVRGAGKSRVEWPLLTVLFLAESQFLLFHAEDQTAAARANERCTRVVCDVLHTVLAVAGVAALMTEHFVMEALWTRFRRLRRPPEAVVYLCVHVLGVPAGGFVAVHLVSWLHLPGLYTANLASLALLACTRLWFTWREWQQIKQQDHAETVGLNTFQDKLTAPVQQTFVSGTQQPRYFFKRTGEKAGKRNKHE